MNARDLMATIGKAAGLEPAAGVIAGRFVQRLLGFWVMWHLAGGLEPLIERGWVSRSGVYRQRGEFHKVMGTEVENFWPEAIAFFQSERERLSREQG